MDILTLALAKKYTDTRISNLVSNLGIKKYGVIFTGSDTAGVRTGDAIGMVATAGVGDEVVQNDFDNVSYFNRPLCCGYHDADGKFHVNAYQGEPGFALDGSKGEVYYECTPFYWNGSFDAPSVTGTPCEGYELAPMFLNPVDKVYLPSYWSSQVGGKATSRSGVFPTTGSLNSHMANMRTYHEKACTETIAARMSEYVLQLVEFATRDVQVMMSCSGLPYSVNHVAVVAETGVNRIIIANAYADLFVIGQTIAIGTAVGESQVCENRVVTAIDSYDAENKAISFDGAAVNVAVGNIVSSRAWKNGATDIVLASSGSPVSNTSGKYPCIWRGKVDPWADGYSMICNILIQRSGEPDAYTYTPFCLPDPTKYNAGAITGDYVELNYSLPGVDGYAKSLQSDSRYKHIALPAELGASSSTYLAAWYSYPRNDVCAVLAGGLWNVGRDCSPVYFNCSNAPGRASLSFLARLFVNR